MCVCLLTFKCVCNKNRVSGPAGDFVALGCQMNLVHLIFLT